MTPASFPSPFKLEGNQKHPTGSPLLAQVLQGGPMVSNTEKDSTPSGTTAHHLLIERNGPSFMSPPHGSCREAASTPSDETMMTKNDNHPSHAPAFSREDMKPMEGVTRLPCLPSQLFLFPFCGRQPRHLHRAFSSS